MNLAAQKGENINASKNKTKKRANSQMIRFSRQTSDRDVHTDTNGILDSLGCNRSFFAPPLFLKIPPKKTHESYFFSFPSRSPFFFLEEKSLFLSYFLPLCNRFPHGNNIRAILLKTQSPLFKILLIFLPNKWRPPFPHAQKINK